MKNYLPIITLLILAVSTGCGPASVNKIRESTLAQEKILAPPPDQGVIEPITLTQEGPVTGTLQTPPPLSPGLNNLVELAKQDLARRLSITPEEITVLEAREVVWPDGSLGCPRSDKVFQLVPQDGVLIYLQLNTIKYAYHAGIDKTPFLCENPGKEITPAPTINLTKHVPPPID